MRAKVRDVGSAAEAAALLKGGTASNTVNTVAMAGPHRKVWRKDDSRRGSSGFNKGGIPSDEHETTL